MKPKSLKSAIIASGLFLIFAVPSLTVPDISYISSSTDYRFYGEPRALLKECTGIIIPKENTILNFQYDELILYHFNMTTEMFDDAENQLKKAFGEPYVLGKNQPDYLGNQKVWDSVHDLPVSLPLNITDENIQGYYYGIMNIANFSSQCDCIPDIFIFVYEENGKEYLYFHGWGG